MKRYIVNMRYSAAACFLVGAVGAVLPVQAEPFSKEKCAELTTERQSLVGQGVEQIMGKGPEWAATNLKQPALDQIKRFIAVDEQLKFRCKPVIAEAKPKKRQIARKPHGAKPVAARSAPTTTARPVAKPAPRRQKPAAVTIDATVN